VFRLLAVLFFAFVWSDAYAQVTVGADRLFSDYSHLIEGKRIALVSNHSGRLSDGTHLADALHKFDTTELIVLFGMNFDIRTNDYSLPRQTGATVDEPTGLPKYSLYGDLHKPTAEMLRGVDAIVFDIQEVGARFYEHINILGFVMEAAAENDIEVIVLDRPNPLTGLQVDGFVTDPEFRYTFGAYTDVPVLHGMTMGELAYLYNEENLLRGGGEASLHVIEMTGWERSMWMDETGIPWAKPSPNLPYLSSVIAYAGTCLFEALNLSEGRGTERPFEYIGAPWLDNESAVELLNSLELPGVSFETVRFTPERMPFHGSDPYMTGEDVRGIFVNITDRDRFTPYRVGVAMVWAVHHLHEADLEWNERSILRLTSTRRFIEMIREGAHYEDIIASWEDEVRAFERLRANYLIY
jgi:uncharacterized protein YbbC (DUF1343 family)